MQRFLQKEFVADTGSVVERKPHERSVAAIILLDPSGTSCCLAMPEKAKKDARLNLAPLQGGIKKDESLWGATIREVREEVGANINTPVVYLCSFVRELTPDHPRADLYQTYRYHWVATYAAGYDLRPQERMAEAKWYFLNSLQWSLSCMSPEKREMFRQAMEVLYHKAGDRKTIRKRVLFPEAQKVSS